MKLKFALAVISAMFVGAALAPAHHSFSAEYDSKKMTITGKFVKMDWVNPHSWVYIEVTNPDGSKTEWKGETPPPNGLYRNGWKRDTLKVGETIEINGNPAKDGTAHMWAGTVRLLDRPKVQGKNGPEPQTLGFGSRPPTEGPSSDNK